MQSEGTEVTPPVPTGWGVSLTLHRHFVQVWISLLLAVKMNLLGSCFWADLEVSSTAGDFVTGLSWLVQLLSARTIVPDTSPLPWNIGLAWRPSDLSHIALPHSCLALFLQSLAMQGSMWHRGFVKGKIPWQHRSSACCQTAGHPLVLCWELLWIWHTVLWAVMALGFLVFFSSHSPLRLFILFFPIGWYQFDRVRQDRFLPIVSSAAWVIYIIFSGIGKIDGSLNWIGRGSDSS